MRYLIGPNARSGPMSYFCDWAVFTLSAGDSFKCSIRLSATHRPLCSDPHPSLPDGVHGPFYILYPIGPNARSGPMSYFCDWAVFTLSAGNSFKCSIRLSATHCPLCSDPHPSLPDGVHGPFYILYHIFVPQVVY